MSMSAFLKTRALSISDNIVAAILFLGGAIVAGWLTDYLSQRYGLTPQVALVFSWAIGLLVFVALSLLLRPKKPQETQTAPAQQLNQSGIVNAPHNEFNPRSEVSQKIEANPRNEFNPTLVVNVSSPQSQAQTQSQPQTQPEEQAKLIFNIECVRAGFVDAWLDESDEIYLAPVLNGLKCKAAVIEFRRNPDDASEAWVEVKTRAELKATNRMPMMLREGRWVGNSYSGYEKFEVFDTGYLAIAWIAEGKAYTYEGHYEDVGEYNIRIFVSNFQPLTESVYDVEVHLHGKSYGKSVLNEILYFGLYVGSPPGLYLKG